MAELPRTRTEGVGYVMTGRAKVDGGVLIVLDLDACVHRDGTISDWAAEIVERTNSYTTVSPSGVGLHVWLLATDLPANLRPMVLIDAPGVAGVDKKPGVQVIGYGPALYATVTGAHVDGTPEDIRLASIGWMLDKWDMRLQPGEAGTGELPRGVGDPPTLDAIDTAVRAEVDGDALVDAHWHSIKAGGEKSASDVYWRLVVRVLRCARRHGATAVDYLLQRTAWGRGQVDDSRDPGKYSRLDWVAGDVARAGDKIPAIETDPASVFADAPLPAAPGSPTPSLLDDRWQPLPIDALTTRPLNRAYLLQRAADTEAPGGGVLPMGQVAFVSAEGGVGKTLVLLQLAVCVAVGKPWLGYTVDPDRVGARSVLLLAEEDAEEAHRRLYWIGRSLDLSPADCRLVAERVIVVPLAGIPLPLAVGAAAGSLPVLTAHYRAVEERLAVSDPLGLIVLDPLARMFPSAETANELATFAIQACERLARRAPGSPAVIAAHHSSKVARRANSADARGVSGLTDGARTSILLRHLDDGDVELSWAKANLHARYPNVRLTRIANGLLQLATAEQREVARAAEIDHEMRVLQSDADALVRALRANGPQRNKRIMAKLAGIRGVNATTALAYALEHGMVEQSPGKAPVWSAAPPRGGAVGRASMFD